MAHEKMRLCGNLSPWSAPVTRQAPTHQDQAKPELHFKFGALAAESHFIPALSQAD